MSIEYFIQSFADDSVRKSTLETILDCFTGQITNSGEHFFRLDYGPDHTCELQLSVSDSEVSDVTIFRPCAHGNLDSDLFKLLRSGPYLLFAPGGNVPIIAREDVGASLPPDVIEALGEPVLIGEGDSISRVLFDED